MSAPCDVLALGAHPDDVEIGCGGTLIDCVARGLSVVIVDMTRGEAGTLGTPELRAQEAGAAAEKLGARERVNLGLPDAGLRDDDAALVAVVGVLRRFRPRVFLVPIECDVHPDHRATAQVAARAFFQAGLANWRPELGAPSRPALVASYFGNDFAEPTHCLDISDHILPKREVIACYASQVAGGADEHRVRKLDVLDRAATRDRYFGSLVGSVAAEPFVIAGPQPIRSGIAALLAEDLQQQGEVEP